jgi:hypothetical protein
MIAQVQITWTEPLLKQAEYLAKLTGHTLEDILPAMFVLSAATFTHKIDFDRPVSELSDEDVLAISNLQMLPEIDVRHSELLQKSGEGTLSSSEREQLNTLQRVYEIGIIYQSFALKEAVLRGLREPLEP